MTSKGAQSLATYGTLAPGKPNHHQLDGLCGTWRSGVVRGNMRACGWAADLGYPGLVLDPQGPEVTVQVFTSADLPDHWERLDAFEGPGYARVVTAVQVDGATVDACIYVLAG